ncbi:MAG: NAD(P)H-dependent oxidoreductase [Xanthomonadales bacterium]|nr:NAD(P)H-dependent oxidoreductase [Gammaproteobacteria bacterium]NNE06184.1 NAD(P)H-dependent oxidoreductase [Xanthomonadales bacterium]NNL95865.1 NAD(P)H-dependent oxidoreductase [Xanthomonadales bacterium]
MAKIIAISGSLRKASFNTGLIKAVANMFPGQVDVGSIRDIPLYDGDLEASAGIPTAVEVLKDQIAESSGLLVATPEYNNSMPGVLKNATDWLTRPPADIKRVFHGKPVALTGVTPGGLGTALAQSAWLPVFRTLRTRPWFEGRLMISSAGNLFDEQGSLTDQKTQHSLRQFIDGFLQFIEDG